MIEGLGHTGVRALAADDRFFLLTMLLHRRDAWNPWIYKQCRMVEAEPDGCLDLWFRESYKSTIITFAGIIQEIIRDPEITIGILSHNNQVAGNFLTQIKMELEGNEDLKRVFPDIFWQEPRREAVRWSVDGGIVVKRKGNPKESTLEASGLVDGMPTGKHYRLRVYDDVVTDKSVGTPEQIAKTTYAWGLSDNLGARGPDGHSRAWHVGTRYHFGDTYQTMLDRGILKARVYPATDTGLVSGKPVLFSQEVWDRKCKTQADELIACQMLLNPAAGAQAMFQEEWLCFSDIRPSTLNIYIMCDPASSRKAGSDRTAIPVIGVDGSGNRWLLDGYHHRMSLSERWEAIRQLRRKWMKIAGVRLVKVGYERYGMTSDIEYMQEMMRINKDSFTIHELAYPSEGGGSKKDRIQRLQPYFKQGMFFLPAVITREVDGKRVKSLSSAQREMIDDGQPSRVYEPVYRRNEKGEMYSLNKNFLDEYLVYPYSVHDDLLDAMSRIQDMEVSNPVTVRQQDLSPTVYEDGI